MDVITSLSIYREALIGAVWTLDAFPVELDAFADRERKVLDSAIKSVEADIRFHRDEADIRFHRDTDRPNGPTFLIFSRTS
ncbi:hypothetical protein [Mesorhizobium sp. YM1C-6-2]|jgi:hypothetical protein|uniref:hypothetical protein n=1 Tax=Mesorhizobium sp. YM1C-6-2 TaxID=1827501 RepID=UPI000EF1CC7F|nr:hypothetical protein [Mesorhizobium sp. YM1C-6-2]RLP27900.1 hypothetical protein D8676_01720 [Mesorhizobium sp. YM1C-6-2]